VCKYREWEDLILILTTLAALLETTSSSAADSPGLAVRLPGWLAAGASPHRLPVTSALGQTGAGLSSWASMETATAGTTRGPRVIHCSFSCFMAHQKNAASSVLLTYKLPVSFLEKFNTSPSKKQC